MERGTEPRLGHGTRDQLAVLPERDVDRPVVARRLGELAGAVDRVDGSPLVYNQDDVLLPDLVVCRPELSEPILAFLRDYGTD